jgi:hypothetical protein
MADRNRFPGLAVPFALVGASAGWLSAGLAANPLFGSGGPAPSGVIHAFFGTTALVAAVMAGATGALIRRLCVGKRRWYEIDDPDPELRAPADTWPLQAGLVVVAGAFTGALIDVLFFRDEYMLMCTAVGALLALAFVPVCLSVIAAARRAQRARHGSLVASSDRRAVWGTLAITLAAATVEALPEWPAAAADDRPWPFVALAVLALAGLATLRIFREDRAVFGQARELVRAGLEAREEPAQEAPEILRFDLGLGEDLYARRARGAAAYRQVDRTVALVQGSPGAALAALERAVRRGKIGLVVVALVGAAHLAAGSRLAWRGYGEVRCVHGDLRGCIAAGLVIGPALPASQAAGEVGPP